MSKICQEKFEVRLPRVPEGAEGGWVSDASARVKKGTRPDDGCTPPGMNMDDQYNSDIHEQPLVMSGETDVSHDWNPAAAHAGFTRRKMNPTDDMWTGEHCDAFYGDVTVDGNTGFLERNNMLDRS